MILRALGFGRKPDAKLLARMPAVNSFVTAAAGGKSGAVTVESIGAKSFTTMGDFVARPGTTVTLAYSNPAGKFRLSTKVLSVNARSMVLALPTRIEASAGSGSAGGGAQKRSSVRLDTIVPGSWRHARNGKGVGEFGKANIRDISRGGASLIIDRNLGKGSWVEVKLMLPSVAQPIVVLGEVMRVEQIPSSGKHSHGLRFHGLTASDDRLIMDFINRKQAELRSRGLA